MNKSILLEKVKNDFDKLKIKYDIWNPLREGEIMWIPQLCSSTKEDDFLICISCTANGKNLICEFGHKDIFFKADKKITCDNYHEFITEILNYYYDKLDN